MTTNNPFRLKVKINVGDEVELEILAPNLEQKAEARALQRDAESAAAREFKELEEAGEISDEARENTEKVETQISDLLETLLLSAEVKDGKVPAKWKEAVKDAGHLVGSTGYAIFTEVCFRSRAKVVGPDQ